MAYQITAARASEVIRTAWALNRETADQVYGEVLRRHPDCEVRLLEGEVILASAGPASAREGER